MDVGAGVRCHRLRRHRREGEWRGGRTWAAWEREDSCAATAAGPGIAPPNGRGGSPARDPPSNVHPAAAPLDTRRACAHGGSPARDPPSNVRPAAARRPCRHRRARPRRSPATARALGTRKAARARRCARGSSGASQRAHGVVPDVSTDRFQGAIRSDDALMEGALPHPLSRRRPHLVDLNRHVRLEGADHCSQVAQRPARCGAGGCLKTGWCTFGRIEQRVLCEPDDAVNVVWHHDRLVDGDTRKAARQCPPDSLGNVAELGKDKPASLKSAEERLAVYGIGRDEVGTGPPIVVAFEARIAAIREIWRHPLHLNLCINAQSMITPSDFALAATRRFIFRAERGGAAAPPLRAATDTAFVGSALHRIVAAA